jgi:hypothetical protein
VALVDPHHLKAAAVAMRRSALELTWAAIVAVAVAERDPFHGPLDHVPSPL